MMSNMPMRHMQLAGKKGLNINFNINSRLSEQKHHAAAIAQRQGSTLTQVGRNALN